MKIYVQYSRLKWWRSFPVSRHNSQWYRRVQHQHQTTAMRKCKTGNWPKLIAPHIDVCTVMTKRSVRLLPRQTSEINEWLIKKLLAKTLKLTSIWVMSELMEGEEGRIFSRIVCYSKIPFNYIPIKYSSELLQLWIKIAQQMFGMKFFRIFHHVFRDLFSKEINPLLCD